MIRSCLLGRVAAALLMMSVGCGEEGLRPGPSELHASAGDRVALGQSPSPASGEERYALVIKVPVHWSQNTGLEAGDGTIEHRVLLARSAQGPTALTLCQLATPGYATRSFFGGEHYAFAFDDAQLRDEHLSTLVLESGEDGTPKRLGVTLGARLDNVFDNPWPSGNKLSDVTLTGADHQAGVTLMPQGTRPPVNRARTRRAERFAVALRHAFEFSLGAEVDGRRHGTAQALGTPSRPHLDSTTLGCHIEGAATSHAETCSRVELYLANAFAPAYRSEPGEATMVRLPPAADCQALTDLSL